MSTITDTKRLDWLETTRNSTNDLVGTSHIVKPKIGRNVWCVREKDGSYTEVKSFRKALDRAIELYPINTGAKR